MTLSGLLCMIVTFLGQPSLLSAILRKKTDSFVCILIIVNTLCDLEVKTDECLAS